MKVFREMPWNDRAGRFSVLRAAAFALVVLPALLLGLDAATGGLGAEPLAEAIHRTGTWAIRLVLVTLAVTPLRRIGGWNRLVIVRRMLGLGAFFYALAHLVLYVADEGWNIAHAASEIATHIYLTVGFVALVGLAVLAATSTDGAIRRLGGRWHLLHQAVYVISGLAVLHFFMQAKADAGEATLMMGLWLLLMGWRLARKAGWSLAEPRVLLVVAPLAALATAGLEAAWYGLATAIPWRAVLEANLSFGSMPRPAWWVLAAGLLAALVPLRRALPSRRQAVRAGSRP